MNHLIAALILTGLLTVTTARASQEEILPWEEVRIVCAERRETGKVELQARLASNEVVTLSITAFGKKHDLPAADLAKLRGFPLRDLRLTHEAGYAELGGHTVHLHLSRVRNEAGKPVTETVTVSVSKGKGLTVGEPRRLVVIGGDDAAIKSAVQMLVPAITTTNDAWAQWIIQPWLKKHQMELPADKDGLLVVYQPWGLVGGAALYLPAKEGGTLRVFNDGQREGTTVAWSDKEWESVRQIVADGKFFDLPYRNEKLGVDGASIYIEARINGRHHRIRHWEPDDPVVQRLANLIGRRPDYLFPIDRATPGAAWQAVGKAMWAGNKEALAKVCSEPAYQALLASIHGQQTTGKEMNTWAASHANWPLEFTSQTDTAATANVGPKGKQNAVQLIQTAAGWKLDKWEPGQ